MFELPTLESLNLGVALPAVSLAIGATILLLVDVFIKRKIITVWLAIVVLAKIRQPVLTLIFTSLIYGFLAIVSAAAVSTATTGELNGPLTNIFVFLAALILNTLWGGVFGIIALVLQELQRSFTHEK